MAPRQLHENDYFRVLADDTARLVRPRLRDDRKPPTVFDDEAEALAFLAARVPIAPAGRSGR